MTKIRIKTVFWALVAVFVLLPAPYVHGQNDNPLSRGEWRKALNKCLEKVTERDDYGVYKGELEEYSIYKGEGDFKYRTGTGIYRWNDGTTYIGGWSGGKDGLGIYIVPQGYTMTSCPNAVYYVGEYYYRKSGVGLCFDEYGNMLYAGEFENDYPTGKYPMTDLDDNKFECKEYSGGSYYVGMTKDGKPDGIGFFIWKNGSLWFGEWENGVRDGYGVLFSYEGKITTGTWKGDKKQ